MSINKFALFIAFFISVQVEAGSVFFGLGADYRNPRIERSENGATSYSTGSELSYDYYGVLGYQFDRKKKHSLQVKYTQFQSEISVPTGRNFDVNEIDGPSIEGTYTYSKQSFEFYISYLSTQAVVYNQDLAITDFIVDQIGTSFVGAGFRLKAYSDKPHNLYSYLKARRYRDSVGSTSSYARGFRLALDFAYFHQLSSDSHLGSEVEYSSKIFAGLQIEKGGVTTIGAKINFHSEDYEYANQSYTLIDFGAGLYLKFNY